MKTTFSNATPKTVETADSVFFFREIGEGGGIPLIFLNHSRGDLAAGDSAFFEGLAVHHRVIIFDKRAAGEATRPGVSNMSDMAIDAIKFIGALGLKLVDLVEFSVGAFVAQRIVRECPDLVRRVFIAGAGPAGCRDSVVVR
jgi:pimeloyl-ACP methyl ester carboxylesterase